MRLLGLDLSITHSGAVFIDVDDEYNIVNSDWLSFTTVRSLSSDKCIYYNPKDYTYAERYAKYAFMHTHLLDFCKSADVIGIEDYAFGASVGRVFDLAEFEGWLRQELWKLGKPIYLYSPSTVKKLFTGYGDADKLSMWEAFLKMKEVKPDLTSLPEVSDGKRGKPTTSDVVDAYAVVYCLKTELSLSRPQAESAINTKSLKDFNRYIKDQSRKLRGKILL